MKLAIIGSRNCPQINIEEHLKFIPDTYAMDFARRHGLKL